MKLGKFSVGISPKLIIPVTLILLFALSLFIRVVPPYDQVFTAEGIKFTSNDSYFFMREVDNLVANFPGHTDLDPYISYPHAAGWTWTSFLVWLIAVPAWIIGLGSPSQHTVDVVAVFLPAVLAALTVIPVYFIGKELFNRWAGVLAAALIAILPGEFLGRSILGFTDNHVAEALFSVTVILFLILAVKASLQRELSLSHLKRKDWAALRKPLIFALLAALSMGVYIYTWLGALLFVFIAFVFFVIQFIIDHLRRKSTDYLLIVGVVFFGVTLLLAILGASSQLYLVSLALALVAVPVLNWLSGLMTKKKLPPVAYPLALILLAMAGMGLLNLVSRDIFTTMVRAFEIFRPSGAQLTTIEMQPLISLSYGNPFAIVWGNYNVSFFTSFIALLVLLYLAVRRSNAGISLMVIWSVIIFLATLGQRRFGYYLAVNVALLSGYFCWMALELAGFKALAAAGGDAVKKAATRRERRRRDAAPQGMNYAVMALAVLVVFFGVFFWNIEPVTVVSGTAPYAPSDGWVSSLKWLKDNSPEPLGSPDAYDKKFPLPKLGEPPYEYPDSAYGVLAWWDYGYWVTRIAHRIPNANPSQDPQSIKDAAAFFTALDEESTVEVQKKLNSTYIILDQETAMSKLWAIITWAGKDTTIYFDSYMVQQQDGSYKPFVLFYPDYYRTMAVRLYSFDGKAQTPDKPIVISYEEKPDKTGRLYKIVTSIKQFDTYEGAEAYRASQTTGNYRIIGPNPMKSIVPLEALKHYHLVHGSATTITVQDIGTVPQVKIFEYVK